MSRFRIVFAPYLARKDAYVDADTVTTHGSTVEFCAAGKVVAKYPADEVVGWSKEK